MFNLYCGHYIKYSLSDTGVYTIRIVLLFSMLLSKLLFSHSLLN